MILPSTTPDVRLPPMSTLAQPVGSSDVVDGGFGDWFPKIGTVRRLPCTTGLLERCFYSL
jgi:hypothetical protein